MLEKQQQRMGAAEFWALNPVLLGVDTAAVQVRRMLEKAIKREKDVSP